MTQYDETAVVDKAQALKLAKEIHESVCTIKAHGKQWQKDELKTTLKRWTNTYQCALLIVAGWVREPSPTAMNHLDMLNKALDAIRG